MTRWFQSWGKGKLGVVLGVLTHKLETLDECFLPRHCSHIHDELLSDCKQNSHTDPVIRQVLITPWESLQPAA